MYFKISSRGVTKSPTASLTGEGSTRMRLMLKRALMDMLTIVLIRVDSCSFSSSEFRTDQDPCRNGFAGPRAFSEFETQHMRDYLLHLKPAPILVLTLHSYGQFWMHPFGDGLLPENVHEMVIVIRTQNILGW